jgi:hypothetical protein
MVKINSRKLFAATLAALTAAIVVASVFSMATTQTLAQTNQEMTQRDMAAMMERMQQNQTSETHASAMNATDMMGGMSVWLSPF